MTITNGFEAVSPSCWRRRALPASTASTVGDGVADMAVTPTMVTLPTSTPAAVARSSRKWFCKAMSSLNCSSVMPVKDSDPRTW